MRRGAERAALAELARRYGIQTSHTDCRGSRRTASTETLVAVLRALGAPLETPSDAHRVLRALDSEGPRVVEPVLVHRGHSPSRHRINLPAAVDPGAVTITVLLEDGGHIERPLERMLDHRTLAASVEGSQGIVTRRLAFGTMPEGYHRLVVEGPGVVASASVVAAPDRCPEPARGWGILAPLVSARTATDWGVASFCDLEELGGWVAGLGGSFVGVLPVFASFLDGPLADPSPYRPASRLAFNELFIGVGDLPELQASPEARRLLQSSRVRSEIALLHDLRLADPLSVMAVKRRVLEVLAAALFSRPSARRRALDAFVAARPELVEYARFRADREQHGYPGTESQTALTRRRRLPHADDPRVRYHLYVQWVADLQLAEAARRTGLYIDLPVGVHPGGFDPWWQPDAFVPAVSAGAPPDDFFAAGQIWGFNPLHPAGARDSGYAYFAAVVRHAMRHAAVVRLDHVMGLHRMWFVPDGHGADDGVYVRYRAEELRAVAVLEAARSNTAVVGEDLGTVQPTVRASMRRDGMLRSEVFQFSSSPKDPFPEPPPDSLASLGTHDLPPFAAWWTGSDIDERVRRGFTGREDACAEQAARSELRAAISATGNTGAGETPIRRSAPEHTPTSSEGGSRWDRPEILSARRALLSSLEHLASGAARLVLVDPIDLWGEHQPHNRPGTGGDEPNFRRRWARVWPSDLEPYGSAPSKILRMVDRARRTGAGALGAGDERPDCR